MEIFRISRDVYGSEVLEGASWDLIPVFAGVGLAVIVVHLVWRWLHSARGDSR